MPLIKTVLQKIYSLYALILFVTIMLIIFPFVIMASFFGRIRGGDMIFFLCRIWADTWFPLIFIFHRRIMEAPHDKNRPYIFVSNHISYIDSAILPKAYRQRVRALGKIELSRVPIFGFIYRRAIVTVDRSSPEHRAESIQILKSLIRKGISVMVFPEGTFNMTDQPLKEFYDGAFRVAIETQTAVKPVLFLDSYDRMHYRGLLTLTPGRSRIVYLPEISVEGMNIEDLPRLKDLVYQKMEERLRHYKVSWIRENRTQ